MSLRNLGGAVQQVTGSVDLMPLASCGRRNHGHGELVWDRRAERAKEHPRVTPGIEWPKAEGGGGSRCWESVSRRKEQSARTNPSVDVWSRQDEDGDVRTG